MIGWTLRRAKASLLRDPFLTRIQVMGLALGVAVWLTAHGAIESQTRTPLSVTAPTFHVELDRGLPGPPSLQNGVIEMITATRLLLSWEDARAVVPALAMHPHARTFSAEVALSPITGSLRVRFTDRDLFSMFAIELIEGDVWGPDDELAQRLVCVIDAATATRLYGTTRAVGRSLVWGTRELAVVGVTAPQIDALRLYDI